MATAHGSAARAAAPDGASRTPAGPRMSGPDPIPSGAGQPVADALSMHLGGGSAAAATARHALAGLRCDIDEPLMETLRLLVTELVANSVRHARVRDVDLRVTVTGSSVLTEITDEGPGFEPLTDAEMTAADSGWGLFLVERLADRWGVSRDGARTRVWFELSRPSAA